VSRIVGGRLGGRRVATPAGRDTRPTADRVREALFNTLGTMVDLTDSRFADLYAGSGAVGLEAASRGAAHVLLVEADPRAARVARENIASLGLAGVVELAIGRVDRVLATAPRAPYDVVFADPPYAADAAELGVVLAALAGNGWLAAGAVVALERASRDAPPVWVGGLVAERSRRYGETTIWYARVTQGIREAPSAHPRG
jgi:16S rRNA (guanine966-N2)-methyltransferase